MRIVDVECHVLLDPGYDAAATSSNQDTIVVEVHTDAGLTGIGETDVNAWVARACIEAPGTHTMDRGLKAILYGRDPRDPEAIWRALYVGTAMSGRRGALVHALGALDIAVWDIAGQAAGVPTWRLLGRPRETPLTPYASLLPPAAADFDAFADALVDQAVAAARRGFRGVKLELLTRGPYRHGGLDVPDARLAEVVGGVRRAVGPKPALMVDVGYGFATWPEALTVLEQLAPHDVFFVETPLPSDDLAGHVELARRSPVRIAAGEWLATRHEFRAFVERGALHVLQPDVGRVGGLTEARRVCELAAAGGLLVVPHGWKTGVTVAATVALAAVTPQLPFFELVPRDVTTSALRRELVRHEPALAPDGTLPLPGRAGLGLELDRDALARFAEAARAVHA